jgi:spoIIIJ-associated protein
MMKAEEPIDILEDMLSLLGVEATVEVQDEGGTPVLNILTRDSSRLIGRNGKTLNDLQYILNRLVYETSPDAPKVIVDVEGYRQESKQQLIDQARKAAQAVREWGDIVELEPMSSYDRWLIHQEFHEDPEVETHSVEVEDSFMKAILLRPRR